MFYIKFIELCKLKGVKPTNVLKDLSLSTSKATSWKDGGYPNVENLIKIADYFDVSIDFLVGRKNNN